MILIKTRNAYRIETVVTPFQAKRFKALLLVTKGTEACHLRDSIDKSIEELNEEDMSEFDKVLKYLKL